MYTCLLYTSCEGTPIAECAEFLQEQDRVEAIGINCTAPEWIEGLIREVRRVSDKPIIVYGNSGEIYDPQEKVWKGAPCGMAYSAWAPRWYACLLYTSYSAEMDASRQSSCLWACR